MTDSASQRTVFDPFLNKDVQVSDRLVDRLRGRYACGPTLPNGEPEFGWQEFQTPPIQHEAAARITELEAERDNAKMDLMHIAESYRCADEERDEMRGRALAAESELSRVEGKVRETLSPFEEAVEGCIDDAAHDSWDIWESPAAMCITVGDLRRAAELLRSLPPLAKRGEQKSRERSNPPAEQSTTLPQQLTEN